MFGMAIACKKNYQDCSHLLGIKKISIAAFLTSNGLTEHFHFPLSGQTFQEFQELTEIVQSTQVSDEEKRSMTLHLAPHKYHI
jgi:Na+-transporting NADH:ubiquinone oxidoreductase subunit NqrC